MANELDGPTEPGTNPNAEELRKPTDVEAARIIRNTRRTEVPPEPVAQPEPVKVKIRLNQRKRKK
jgi:hypothetical protein